MLGAGGGDPFQHGVLVANEGATLGQTEAMVGGVKAVLVGLAGIVQQATQDQDGREGGLMHDARGDGLLGDFDAVAEVAAAIVVVT